MLQNEPAFTIYNFILIHKEQYETKKYTKYSKLDETERYIRKYRKVEQYETFRDGERRRIKRKNQKMVEGLLPLIKARKKEPSSPREIGERRVKWVATFIIRSKGRFNSIYFAMFFLVIFFVFLVLHQLL